MNKQQKNKGQAVVELIVILPVLFFLMIFSYQIFKSIYHAQQAQEIAREKLLKKIDNVANGGKGMNLREVVTDVTTDRIQTGGLPILGTQSDSNGAIPIRIGICRTIQGCP